VQFLHGRIAVHIVPASLYVVTACTKDHRHSIWSYYPRLGSGTMTIHAHLCIRGDLTQSVSTFSRSTSLFRARGKRKRRRQPLKSRSRPAAIAGINILLRDYRREVSHADHEQESVEEGWRDMQIRAELIGLDSIRHRITDCQSLYY